MADYFPQKFTIDGVSQYYFKSHNQDADPQLQYRPAVLAECSINFRSLRAGLNHSEERSYTAWLPTSDLAIDWDTPAANVTDGAQLSISPERGIGFIEGNYKADSADLSQYGAELTEKLVRSHRLRIYFNPVFGLFSSPSQGLDNFLGQVAEAALGRVEPELKRLRNRCELQLEQVREAHSGRGLLAEGLGVEKIILHNLHFFESENRLTAMFSTLAGSVFGTTEPRAAVEPFLPTEAELREDLARVEQEASEALRDLYAEYMFLANEYDVFEIGLQPDNIQINRRALLWVPVPAASLHLGNPAT